MKKSILKIMLGSIILEVVLVCMFILIGRFDGVSWRALGSVGIIFVYSIPCLFYSKIYDDENYKYVAVSGAVIVCILALIRILNLWDLIGEWEILEEINGTFNVIIWMLAFISWILSFISVNNLLNLFKKISVSLILLLGFFETIIIWTSYPKGFLSRLYYVLIVLTVGSFICVLILTKIYKKEITEMSQSKKLVQSIDNHVTQNQNIVTTQPTINSIPTSVENVRDNSLNSNKLSDNNESDNNNVI